MKKLLFIVALSMSFPSFARNPKLDPAVEMVTNCLAEQGVMLCNNDITEVLKTVSLDARGEFIYYLKEILVKNEIEKVVVNLYERLQVLLPVYESIDGNKVWSTGALSNFLADVSISYVKMTPIDSALYIKLYKTQATQGGRFALLTILLEKGDTAKKIEEMDELIKFAEVAKNYSRSIRDEAYLYQTSVSIVRKMTIASLKLRPGHEGIYKITFDNPKIANTLKIDNVVVMESNDRDALVIDFVATNSHIIKVSFKQAGLLGNTFFSNEDIYDNDNNQEIQSPFFKMELNRIDGTLKGVLASARYGKSTFTGKLEKSNLSVYEQPNVGGLEISQLVGEHNIKVGNYNMTLIISKRSNDRSVYEGALFNDNALITFSKVSLDSEKGIICLIDSNNQRKLTLGIIDFSHSPVFKGQFLNALQAKILDIESNSF